jgi:hypothetical protein
MDEATRGYLAGFFDGEGSIVICKGKTRLGYQTYRLRITTSQVVPEPINLFKKHFGGLIQLRPRVGKHRDIFAWEQHSQKAVSTLEELYPYLIVKKQQAKFAIDWAKENKKLQGRKKTDEDLAWCESAKETLSKMKGFL